MNDSSDPEAEAAPPTDRDGEGRTAAAPRTSRRRFLELGLWGGVVLGVGGLLAYRTTGYRLPEPLASRLTTLSLKEAVILGAITDRILAQDRPGDPSAQDVDAVAFIDRFVARLGSDDRRDLGGLLQLVEHGLPWLQGHLRRFTRLSPEAQDELLEAMSSRLGATLAGGFDALRSLCVLAYYRDPRTWDTIGYDGPLLQH